MKGNGINELNLILNEDFSSTINNKFRYLKDEINHIKEYMIVLINSPDVKLISKKLSNSLKVIYNNIKNEFNNIIPPQINNVIFKKLSLFENEILSLIPDKYINNLLIQLKSSDFKIRMDNERVTDLLPKSFPEGFKSNLTSYFKEILNDLSLNSFKQKYENEINTNLNELSTLLNNSHYEILDMVSSKSQGQTSQDMPSIIDVVEDFMNEVDNYNSTFTLEFNNDKINEIINLFNYISEKIKTIRIGFEQQIQIGESQVEYEMFFFNSINVTEKVERLLNEKKIGESVSKVNQKLNYTMNLLGNKIGEIFDLEMRDKLPLVCENINVNGFKLKDKETEKKIRNLKDYNLNQINDYIKYVEKVYKQFNHTILTNKNFIQIRTNEGNFINSLINSYNHIDDYFYRYEYLIKEYTKLGPFTQDYKNQSLEVQKYIQKFLTEQVSKIDYTVNTIQNTVKYNWNHVKKVINRSIKDALDIEFMRILNNLNPLNENDINFNIEKKTFDPINIYDQYQQLIFTINLETLSNNLTYSYYMKKENDDNMFNFNIDIHNSGNLEVLINTEIDGIFKGELRGILGSGTIGIRPYYYLEDKSVEVNAYFKSDPFKYYYLLQDFDFENWKFNIELEKEIEVQDIQDFNITKFFKHGN